MKAKKLVDGVRILSIKQPWAWAILEGRKRVENRKWTTSYRGPVLIHASAGASEVDFDEIRSLFRLRPPERAVIDRGRIVGVVELVDVVTRTRAGRFGLWFRGRYGLVLANPVKLRRPVRLKSQLGLYRPTPALLARVNAQLPARRRIHAGER